ncbi:hypothetical protein [Spirillospora sp. NPDC047279]|uniref:hypothetical protein n=1 Tax=Spirillospora sp. NPDC047279 TaxID=3155478 RepID=UPI00340F0390
MKPRPLADFPVKVFSESTEKEPETAHLYAGIFNVTLNHTTRLVFVPDLSPVAPPWRSGILPENYDDIATVREARLAAALKGFYVVTPNAEHAGTEEPLPDFPDPDGMVISPPGTVFYVAHAEFDRYQSELAVLEDLPGFVSGQVSELRDHQVITFIERRILDSAWLKPYDAHILGRPTSL